MIDPDLITTTLVAAFQSMPQVVLALGGDDSVIIGHYFRQGEPSIARTIYEATQASVIVAFGEMYGGNFNATTVWKYRYEVYLRAKNIGGATQANLSIPHIWWMMLTQTVPAVGSGTQNLRYARILPNLFLLDAMPQLIPHVDQDGNDYFCGHLIMSEDGDAPMS